LGRSFEESATVVALRTSKLSRVPEKPGVYVVIRPPMFVPVFLEASAAGRFNGRDPTVSSEVLRNAWVAGASVLYIGKAGGRGLSATLRSRMRCYLDYGSGKAVGHEGGRYIWQLKHSAKLLVAWRHEDERDPAAVESALIQRFTETYGRMPFANLRR